MRDVEYEHRVTCELESWLGDRRQYLKEQHRHWTEKLKSDVSAKDAELAELLAAREADQKQKQEVTRECQEASKFVEEELSRREAERLAKERAELEETTAVFIQAWWRMIMVRKGLGQFRKKKLKMQQQGKSNSKSSSMVSRG